jgi:DHA3 family macrolide efflux protein-like MFS transporter
MTDTDAPPPPTPPFASAAASASPGAAGLPGPFLLLWSGQALSLLGSQAVQFALVWWLTRETGSATVLATATFLALAPQVVLGPVIGALVDRWSRKRVMLTADAAVAVAAAGLAALFLAGRAETFHVLALVAVRAVGGAFHGPALLATTPLMVGERQLARVQGLNQALQGLLLLAAAPAGAALYAALPMAGVMAVDVGTALLALAALAAVAVPRPPTTAAGPPSLRREVGEGFRYLAARRGHLALLALAAFVNLSLVPAFALLPLLVAEWGRGATALGTVSALFGAGTLAGGALLGAWGGGRRRIDTALAALAGLGLATLALGTAPGEPLLWAGAAATAVGALAALTNGPILAILQATIAPEYQGRVFTLYASLGGLMAPVGLAFSAPVAEALGVRAWYLAGGVACVLAGVAGFLIPAVREIEGPRPAP